jgi:glycosyltransferase involved in cell wall biosynthesis
VVLPEDVLPTISIIIPTYNSERVIESCLKAAMKQNYPRSKFEVILVDNCSKDRTVSISKDLGAKVFTVTGTPSQACAQRNLGAKRAQSDYLFFLDHDMEMSENLLKDFSNKIIEANKQVEAWYVPEKIIASSALLTKIRTFERSFYDGTIVDAARIIRKERFFMTKQYDTTLSSGPADWDMDIQLKEIGCAFGIINECVYHHEDRLALWTYLTKKTKYNLGGEIYKEKWRKNQSVYEEIVSKQYSSSYRLVGIFFENKKWVRVAKHFNEFAIVIFLRLWVGLFYFAKKNR